MTLLRLLTIILICLQGAVLAAEGELDATFGTHKVITAMGPESYAQDSALQDDGKIVLAGYTVDNTGEDVAIARYDDTGFPDTSFGTDGYVINTDSLYTKAYGVAIQSDRNIVVAGLRQDSDQFGTNFHIIRYTSNGSLDTSFSSDGKVTTELSSDSSAAYSVAVQDDGMIVAAGYHDNGTDKDFAIVRYDTDGSLDTTFGTNGVVTTDIEGNDIINSVAIQADGKIIVAGESGIATKKFTVLRYSSKGVPDTSFSTDGKDVISSSNNMVADDIAIQSDGKIIISGASNNSLNDSFFLVRYNTDGSLDTSFSTDGKVTTAISGDSRARSVAIQADGKIIAAGYAIDSNRDFASVRYNSDGSLDTSYGTNGKLTSPVGLSHDIARSALIQDDGKIILAGSSLAYVYNGENYLFSMLRYTSDGSIDDDFAGGGKIIAAIGPANDRAYDVAIQSDGKIVVAGSSEKVFGSTDRFIAIIRYNSNGSLDDSFGDSGVVKTSVGIYSDLARSLVIQSDGKIVVTGYSENGSVYNFVLVRLNSDGSLDTSFDTDGKITDIEGRAFKVGIQADGKILVTGMNSSDEITLIRYNSDGSRDSSFDGDGLVTTALSGVDASIYAMAIQSDGKIVVGGITDDYKFLLLRYNSNGVLDGTFGTAGVVVTAFSGYAILRSIAVQGDGKIVAVGDNSSSGNYDVTLVRYNSDGSLDTSFDNDGIVVNAFGTSHDQGSDVYTHSNGKILVVGQIDDGVEALFAVVRYNTDGSLDSSFGTNGVVKTEMVTGSSTAYAVAVQANGKIVAAGTDNENFIVVRYNASPQNGSLGVSGINPGIIMYLLN